MRLEPFRMERWQSTWENRVRYNLSESGVHPLTVEQLLELAGMEAGELHAVRLGYGQSNGTEPLRERIAALYPGAAVDSVLVTAGSAEANFISTWYLSETGESAAVMLPNYMQVPGLLDGFGMTLHPYRLREEEGWRPDLDALRDAVDRGCRLILVTNPNNPTGAVFREDTIDRVVAEAERVGAWILADEVYQGAELAGDPTPSFWGRYDRVLVVNSLSKAYGLPGLRLGWVVAPPETVAHLWARTDYTTISPSMASDVLATAALEASTREKILGRTRSILTGNMNILSEWLQGHGKLFRYRPPDAGAICYLRYGADVNSSELAERLRVEEDVLVVPGDHFGMDRYLRIGFGLPEADLRTALDGVSGAFARVAG